MATFVSNVFYFFLASLILILISVSSLQIYYDKTGPSNQDQLLIVNKGQSVASIASHLRDLNLIENRVVFMITLRLKGFHNKIKFGEYMIPRAASMREIIEKLVSGVSAQYTITIPEGLSTISVIDLINNEVINVNRATLTNNNLPINQTTAELIIPAESFINILPNKVISEANIYINPNGQSNIEDFFYPEHPIEATMNIDIPLSLIAENLTFIDTNIIDLPNNNEYTIDKIYLKIDNGLPFEANLQLILLDENNLVVDTLLDNSTISAAQVNENNVVVNSNSSTITIDYREFQNVKKMISISKFTTKPMNQFIDIYSNNHRHPLLQILH